MATPGVMSCMCRSEPADTVTFDHFSPKHLISDPSSEKQHDQEEQSFC